MLNETPQFPLDILHRVRVDGRLTYNKERIALVRAYRPKHYKKYGGSHYISKEAYAYPIEELRQLSPTFDARKETERHEIKELLTRVASKIDKL